jgi:hypothetical protein
MQGMPCIPPVVSFIYLAVKRMLLIPGKILSCTHMPVKHISAGQPSIYS